jgi:L-rhamnose-H+ transport protein
MSSNPFLGVLYHWTGGLAAASFYIPFRRVQRWAWETYWLVGGIFSWIVVPWAMAVLFVPDVPAVILATPRNALMWVFAFGALWGLGGLTFGLTVRYLGIALGVAVALGLCNAFGTLVPPIVSGDWEELVRSRAGQVILVGVFISLIGIAVSGLAGVSKERELSADEKQAAVPEFDFRKGILVAIFCGVMSACFAYGIAAGAPLARLTREQLLASNRSDLWQNLPVLIVVLAGGFITNCVWCVILNVRNRTGHQYFNLRRGSDDRNAGAPAPLLTNYAFSALAGTVWYLQFFFYSMGETEMGRYGFSSWTLHMASIIIFSTLWGVALKEWKGTSRRTHALIAAGLAVLVASTLIVGYGNFIKQPVQPITEKSHDPSSLQDVDWRGAGRGVRTAPQSDLAGTRARAVCAWRPHLLDLPGPGDQLTVRLCGIRQRGALGGNRVDGGLSAVVAAHASGDAVEPG